MKKAILATKVGMTQIFNEETGVLIPVTVLQAGPCVVTQVKTVENDGYKAVQVGFVDKKEKIVTKDKSGKKEIAHRNGVTKAEKGHFDKAGVSGKRYVKDVMKSKAAAEAERIRAEGEAQYMQILSNAYNDASKADFYNFVRSLDAAKVTE